MTLKIKESSADETIIEEVKVEKEEVKISLLDLVLSSAPSSLHESLTILVKEIEKLKK